jgi:hypothetical protein
MRSFASWFTENEQIKDLNISAKSIPSAIQFTIIVGVSSL